MQGLRIRQIVVVAAVAAASTAVGAPQPTRAHAVSIAPGFATPVPSGIQGNGFEQDVRLDPANNTVYTSAPFSLSSGTSAIWHSTDGGSTFKEIPALVQPVGKPISCVGGGDSELGVDSASHLYYNDLTLVNFSVSRSDNNGTSFATASCTGVPNVSVDRQWYATHGDPTAGGQLALAYDRFENPNTPFCAGLPDPSPTGNILVFNLSPVMGGGATAGAAFGPAQTVSCDEGIMGNDEMFDYGPNGGLKAFVVHDNRALNSISMGRCDVVGVSLANPTGLINCQDKPVSSFPGFVTGGNFPTMGVDTTGSLFAVWEEAPGTRGAVSGNTQLYYSTSVDQGNTWTGAQQLPTPGLNQDVFAWAAAGDAGRIDVAFYGAPESFQGTKGPDSTNGHYSLYLAQNLTGSYPLNPSGWSVTLASEHFEHYGTQYTLIGGQSGNRSQGDFLQLRIGAQGEANISYSDSNNQNSSTTPEAMFVRQNSGPSVFANANGTGQVNLPPASSNNCVTGDPAGANDATFDSNSVIGLNNPNLDITGVCMSQPDPAHYQVTMSIANLSSLTPSPTGLPGGGTLIWQTQWHEPSHADTINGGVLYFVDAESVGGTVTCYDGQAATQLLGGGVEMTYPGTNALAGSACAVDQTLGTITITAPISHFSSPAPDSSTLFSVTGSTQTIASGNSGTGGVLAGIGGQLPSLIDVAPAFDFNPTPGGNVPEAPFAAPLAAGGAAVVFIILAGRRRRGQSRRDLD